MLKHILNFFTSLRLTVACLAMALVLVFIGTLAQVRIGLYEAQTQYFHSLVVFWTPKDTQLRIPVWPGGYLLGGLLLVNLIAAHIKRFSLTRKKIGIFLIHSGLILLFLGQFLTELMQVESLMRIEEGSTRNYSEDSRHNELAIVDITDPTQDKVIAIPEPMLRRQKEIRHPDLPFTLRVQQFYDNSFPAPALAQGDFLQSSQGIGQRLKFEKRPITATMDDENKPAVVIEVLADQNSLGTWTVSTWFTKYPWVAHLRGTLARPLGSILYEPQTFTHAGRTWKLALRPIRYYKPYSITLLDFTHDRYKGTDIPKNFSSKIHLNNPQNNEDREVLIYMNNPLRYGGETYYQGGFEPGDIVSVLQVVRNPAWLTPYLACVLVGAGLLTQFLMHLIGFARKSAASSPTLKPPGTRPERGRKPGGKEPALAGVGGKAALEMSNKRSVP